MATVTFIVGYCGSGKTPLAEEMESVGLRKFDEGFLIDPGLKVDLVKALRSNTDCVVVDVGFCCEEKRDSIEKELLAEAPNVAIQYVFFEADLDKANQNCRTRKNKPNDPEGKQHIEINNRIGSRYKVPLDATPRPINVWA